MLAYSLPFKGEEAISVLKLNCGVLCDQPAVYFMQNMTGGVQIPETFWGGLSPPIFSKLIFCFSPGKIEKNYEVQYVL